MGVISGVVDLVLRLGWEECSIPRADDAWQLAEACSARGESSAEELDVLRLLVQA